MSIPDWWNDVEPDIDACVVRFAEKIRQKLTVHPGKMIRGKNPFLFRARTTGNANGLVESIIAAYLSSSEETMFGHVLEDIVITICSKALCGWKSGIEGVDLEWNENSTRCIAQIKSGPRWGNASQRKKLVQSLQAATKVLRQGNMRLNVRCIEGICYGPDEEKDLGSHIRITGPSFWKTISGWEGTAGQVLDVIGKHSVNGLQEPKETASTRMVEYLEAHGVIGDGGAVRWEVLYNLLSLKKLP